MEGQSKDITYHTDYNIQVSDMCSELHYFVIFDFPHTQITPENMARKPTIVTFRYEDINFREILKRYTKLCRTAKERQYIKFSLSRGFIIPLKFTILELKKRLRKDSIDGVVLFTFEGLDDEEDEQDDSKNMGDFVNECGLMDYIQIEQDFDSKKKFTFHFLLPNTKFVISILIHPSEKVISLIDSFFKEVAKEFEIQLEKDDIKQFKILPLTKTTKEIDLKPLEIINNHNGLYDNTEIQVILYDKKMTFIKKVQQVNIITLIKETVNPKDNKIQQIPIKLNYEQVKNMQISKIHEQFILQKSQCYNKSIPVCLKVMEIIIKGDQKLIKLNFAIQKLKELGDVKLVGFFISQKIVFYKEIPFIVKANGAQQFTLEQLQIPSQEFETRTKCDQMISDRLGKIEEDYFRDKKHVQPIFIYTSNLKFKGDDGKNHKIYDQLNKTLRNESVLLKRPEELSKEWVYRYTSTLLKHLENIKGQQCKVYRGVNYDPEGRQGDLITFKPFTSTSKSQIVGVQFAICGMLEYQKQQEKKAKQANIVLKQLPKPPLVLFQMHIQHGKPINKLSYYDYEEELLLQPFTQFRIIKKRENVKKRFPDAQGVDYQLFTVYELQQINSSKKMPETINNYILWIDDKPNEGKQIFNKFIQEFYYPTVLFQIPSTQILKEWISQRQNIINDESSKIIMVTNMVRRQNGQRNFYAGVQSINLIRQALPNIPIAVYVRDINASNNNLNEKNVHRQNLVVISQFEDLANFASKHTSLKFKSFVPFQEEPVHQTAPTYTKSHSTSTSENKKPKSTLSKQQKGEKGICNIM